MHLVTFDAVLRNPYRIHTCVLLSDLRSCRPSTWHIMRLLPIQIKVTRGGLSSIDTPYHDHSGQPVTLANFPHCYNPPAKYVIGQLVIPLANGSLFVHGSTHSQITLNTDPPTKSARDLSVKAQVLPDKADQ